MSQGLLVRHVARSSREEVAKGSQTLMTKSFWVFLGIRSSAKAKQGFKQGSQSHVCSSSFCSRGLVLSLLAFPSLYRLVRRLQLDSKTAPRASKATGRAPLAWIRGLGGHHLPRQAASWMRTSRPLSSC